ncbi:MAG: nucleoside hydrolase [Bacteroidota bacterium]
MKHSVVKIKHLPFKKIAMLPVLMMVSVAVLYSCSETQGKDDETDYKHHVIFDTDADNEIDDQHALAYLFFNGDDFAVEGVTVNATSSPVDGVKSSHVSDHYDEAKRIMQLCNVHNDIPLFTGAQGSFEEIKDDIDQPDFDGHKAVDFIIEQALEERNQELILLPVGKLTNIALALLKEPAIAKNVRIVWLGSNYPEPGEHNLNWDIKAMNYILNMDVPFEMVTVRYGDPSGTDAVKVTQAQILHRMPGKGPQIPEPITGRHDGQFDNWGDYSANLFEMYDMGGDPPSRPLFDQAAVAVVKNPDWAESYEHPAPIYKDGKWIERSDNPRKIIIWEWFDIYGIINDFFVTMNNYVIAEKP